MQLMRAEPEMPDVNANELVDLDARTVSARILTDPDVYRLELERIFDRSWVAVAHESELPNRGDFVTRYIGEDRVIVSRDAAGEVKILLNSCSHRGTQVCRAEQGNAKTFTCPYHGWVYGNGGELLGILAEKDAFGEKVDKSTRGLPQARVGNYQGIIFGTWNTSGPSLDDYLGDIRWYMDIVFGAVDGGMEVTGPPIRWVVPCNWKLGADNFSADGYHVAMTHRSLVETGLFPPEAMGENNLFGVNITDPDTGHGLRCAAIFPNELPLEDKTRTFGIPDAAAMAANLEPGQIDVFRDCPPIVGNVFPNFAWLNAPFPTELGGPIEPLTSIRIWQPRGPDHVEIITWPLVYKTAPDEIKEACRRCVTRTFSASGILDQDDAEIWTSIQRAAAGVRGGSRSLSYLSSIPANSEGWPGPLTVYPGFAAEDNQWNFYRRWQRMMSTDV